MHLALLGDSIFDNGVYVAPDEPDVIQQVNEGLLADDHATLLAVDGHTTYQLPQQLVRVSDDMTHLIVSIGGNDALGYMAVLQKDAGVVAGALLALAQIRQTFDQSYRRAIAPVIALGRSTALCTVYNPRYSDPDLQTATETAVVILNDVIYRVALDYGLPLLELRAFFTADADYANPIEPSAIGGAKLAQAITRVMTQHDFTTQQTVIW
jgi:lysophospholipase L1-like esterase